MHSRVSRQRDVNLCHEASCSETVLVRFFDASCIKAAGWLNAAPVTSRSGLAMPPRSSPRLGKLGTPFALLPLVGRLLPHVLAWLPRRRQFGRPHVEATPGGASIGRRQ